LDYLVRDATLLVMPRVAPTFTLIQVGNLFG